jgi:transposase-like protein
VVDRVARNRLHLGTLSLALGDGERPHVPTLHMQGRTRVAPQFTELKNRGLDDVLMLVSDGLKGLPEAVETVWPRTIV